LKRILIFRHTVTTSIHSNINELIATSLTHPRGRPVNLLSHVTTAVKRETRPRTGAEENETRG
jgi:hypothetical protein